MFEKVAIPRKYHRILLGDKSIFIHDIENKTNYKFRFPDKETASDVISIFGPESQVHIAATMLLVRYSQLEDITLETKNSNVFLCRIMCHSRPRWQFLPARTLRISALRRISLALWNA